MMGRWCEADSVPPPTFPTTPPPDDPPLPARLLPVGDGKGNPMSILILLCS